MINICNYHSCTVYRYSWQLSLFDEEYIIICPGHIYYYSWNNMMTQSTIMFETQNIPLPKYSFIEWTPPTFFIPQLQYISHHDVHWNKYVYDVCHLGVLTYEDVTFFNTSTSVGDFPEDTIQFYLLGGICGRLLQLITGSVFYCPNLCEKKVINNYRMWLLFFRTI